MAAANGWSVAGAAIPATQFKPLCCLKKSTNPTFLLLGLGSVPSSRTLRSSSKFHCRCVIASTSDDNTCTSGSSLDWDWERWTRHFNEVEEAESSASSIKFQLEDAIEREDFQEAAKLKLIISEFSSKDSVAKITSELKIAVDEERYHDASRLCKDTGSGLVGWWVGYSNDSGEPFGRLVHITPSVGRFVGRSYSPRQLVTASPGTPMFEIFVVKEADETYVKQVVYFGRGKGDLGSSIRLLPKPINNSLSASESQNTSVKDVQGSEAEAEKTEDKGMNFEGTTDEGIRSVINFLKDKIPGLKMKVPDVEVVEDGDFVEQLIEEEEEEESSGNSEDEDGDLEELLPGEIALIGGSSAKDEDTPTKKLILGGVVHYESTPTKDAHARLSADIKDMERDSFVLHVPRTNLVDEIRESKASKVKVASIAAQDISQLMQSDIAKAFWSADKISSKVSKNAREIVKLAVSQARKRNRLTEFTTFNRIVTPEGNLDPFEGLYVGSFGPHGTEVVQLRRKFGHWNTDNESSEIEFFEYVEAVKLTGDVNVPAGEVTFRAKIGKGSCQTKRGLYPDELGVAATYRGEGRIAEFGFKNPRWVVGELLQFSGKGMGQYVKGASLGFLYAVPEQSFLVLFNRLRLPE